jgi:anaerobic ribonucleoside-triphosphate reductase
MKTQTKNQNCGWADKAQRKQQAGYLNTIAKQNKGKNLLAPEQTD